MIEEKGIILIGKAAEEFIRFKYIELGVGCIFIILLFIGIGYVLKKLLKEI